MIKTPLGQWINPELLPFINVEYNPYNKDYWISFYYSNGQRQLIANGYKTEEEAHQALNKLISKKESGNELQKLKSIIDAHDIDIKNIMEHINSHIQLKKKT